MFRTYLRFAAIPLIAGIVSICSLHVASADAPVTDMSVGKPASETSDQDAARARDRTCRLQKIEVIDEYLWRAYGRAERRDWNRKRGTYSDFAWKDPAAAKKVGLGVKEYVIGGVDLELRVRMYCEGLAMDAANLCWGITRGFSDKYRQHIADGQKAADENSWHGSKPFLGYGRGKAFDVVACGPAEEREPLDEKVWAFIDGHEKEYLIGRPYGNCDGPHVGPIDGYEYQSHHGSCGRHAHATGSRKKHTRKQRHHRRHYV